ncbi:hypothetical protein F4Z98_03320 [Candidatus Poribacteria bacterium]|nr:hypothetical protein [Candidatus Poribacteria bacterium]MYA99393.1 hypothetical protein [Candidatus Poribacteria bacterium]MYI35255.1 hypothetical protein [Acidimicrobiaceae bacterium]
MGKPFFKYEYKGFHGCDSVCNLEIHQNLVICSSREDNKGTSITNMAEHLATAICKQFDITPSKLIWIEHYRAEPTIERSESTRHSDVSGRFRETYSLVFFNLTGGGVFDANTFEFSNPRWVSIEKVIVDALIDTHKDVEEPPISEWTDGKDFDEPYATEPEDRV